MSLYSEEIIGIHAAPRALSPSPTLPLSSSPRYESAPAWMARRWEAAETDRLNEAHWLWAADESINVWLSDQLPTLRARAGYEAKQNGTILGMMATHADDIVGQDGPELQVQSDDEQYNRALEQAWQDWFYAPTHVPNLSGAALLKLWIKGLHKAGAFLAQIFTDRLAEGPVQMRLRPMSTRRLGSPAELASNPRIFMGIEYDDIGRPLRYWIQRQTGIGTGVSMSVYDPVPAELIVYEYLWQEEDQGAGVPWLTPALQPAADLRALLPVFLRHAVAQGPI